MKRNYQTPAICVVRIQQSNIICASEVKTVSSNANLIYRGASSTDGNPEARVKDAGYSVWDDDWAE